jgi:hypothetical protein
MIPCKKILKRKDGVFQADNQSKVHLGENLSTFFKTRFA